MKITSSFLVIFFAASCASGKQKEYTGSTPAGPVVRTFLGIPLTDSIDFIRWNLVIDDNNYALDCHYGISKPNTNGFMNDGKKISIKGSFYKEKNNYHFSNVGKTLRMLELNGSLLHILDDNNHMLRGNGGWSYTLNSKTSPGSDVVSIKSPPPVFKDSIVFEGRTPCKGFRDKPNPPDCYKIKWLITLYTDSVKHTPTSFRTGTVAYPGKKGVWSIINGKDGRIIYRLDADTREVFYLLKLDENILIFTDERGRLLVGDHDFSYTLSRRG
jgi:hypothetical protein